MEILEAAVRTNPPVRSGAGWNRQERSRENVLRTKISAAMAKCQDAISGNSADSDGKRKRL